MQQIQDQFGTSVYGHVLHDLNLAAQFINETNELGDPLEMSLEIKEKPDGN